VNGQNLDIAYSSPGDTTAAHVGTYAISGVVSSGSGTLSDYFVTLKSGTLAVVPHVLTRAIGNDRQTYGTPANLAADLGTVIATGINGQDLEILYNSSGDTAAADVGSYGISGALSNGTGQLSDYSVTLMPGTLAVKPYSLGHKIGDDSQTYGTAADLGADLPATISTGVNGQNLDIVYTSAGDTNNAHAGTYAITGILSNGTGLASDYAVTLTPGTLTVDKYDFTYAIGNDSQTSGTAANLAADLPATIATGGNGQSLGIAYSSPGDNAAATAGIYAINATVSNGSGLASDYTVTLISGALTVKQAQQTSFPPVTVESFQWVTVKAKHKKPTKVLKVFFSGALNANDANSTAPFVLDSSTKSKKFGTRFNKPVSFKSATYNPTTNTVTLTPRGTIPNQEMELTINGSVLLDAHGQDLDGNFDGQPGGNYTSLLNSKGLISTGLPAVSTKAVSAKAVDALLFKGHLDVKTKLGSGAYSLMP
jgi:hypothetical protein